ncbi:HNH endonuclease signature motif containing protein [Kribbella sp. VKM Ac-2568]|uniref:HNH endonuclease signature motif containing protein n=1 Tax=Kribbella sp. VKM Ac-2568 TaxID=2512219 RepID=UPI0010D81A01|nr:HNH endonuclease signature motif containing protein [Kribbella sp. VKM Ac-2568]TCM51318.1 uncharacterized protein DUF222 [Kribbella sp. VKM Ac-2568]
MEILGERPVWSMSDSEQLSTLDALHAEISRLQTYRLQVLAGYDASGHAATLGAGDTARLLAFRHRLDPGVIKRDLALAKALRKYPAVASALPPVNPDPVHDTATDSDSDSDSDGADGSDADANPEEPDSDPGEEADAEAGPGVGVVLSPAQAAAIVSELENVPKTVAVEDLAVAEQQLVGLGRHFAPSELRKAARRVRDLLDADGPAPEEDKAYAREELRVRPADRGVKFSGYLANENAELFQALILDGAKPRKTVTGELDPRGPDKRRADALTDVLNVASNAITTAAGPPNPADPADPVGATLDDAETAGSPSGNGTPAAAGSATQTRAAASGAAAEAGHGPKAHITITIDLKDLTDAGAHAVGTLVHGEGLSAGAIRRLACEAQIIPIVLGANSEPLDVGMAQRFVNRAMRRALNARDKGCVVCKAPPIFCDAHHLISWIDNGPTALTNLVLLCRRHHIDTHHGHWTITLHHGTVTVARPAWAEPSPTRTRYRTPASSYGGAAASPGPVRNHAHDPAPTTTANTAVAQFDPWADTDPPDPASGKHTRPPGDPPPGHRALHHADNPPPATTDRDWRPSVVRSTEPRTGPPCARPG